jgi:hypothetical protein
MDVTHKWLKLKDKWSENSVCARCHQIYQEITNVGRWECSWHPGQKVIKDETRRIRTSGPSVSSPLIVWSCCGRHWSSNHEAGCVPCDHTQGRIVLDETDNIHGIHESWVRELKCVAGSIIRDGGSRSVTIKRTQ